MTLDGELLQLYARSRSEDAFAELVRRYVNLVYSAALRQVNGDVPLAQDIAQSVFTELARNAAPLSRRRVLSGWLYTCAHFAAVKAVRGEARRRHREQQAHVMNELLLETGPDPHWEQLRPVLDEIMQELGEPDRELILLRYFENRRLGEIAAALGIHEDTARKRVERALERLRQAAIKRGFRGAASLAATLSCHAVQIAPPGLAATLTSGSVGAITAASASTVANGATAFMSKLQITLGGALAACLLVPLLFEHHALAMVRGQIAELARQEAEWTQAGAEKQSASQPAPASLLSLRQLSDLMRLRAEAARQRDELKRLRAKLAAAENSAVARTEAISNYFPKASWASAGYETPAAAVQSDTWGLAQAILHRDTNAQGLDSANWDGLRIVNEQFTTNDSVTVTYMIFSNGGTNDGWFRMSLTRAGDQWKQIPRTP